MGWWVTKLLLTNLNNVATMGRRKVLPIRRAPNPTIIKLACTKHIPQCYKPTPAMATADILLTILSEVHM